MKFNSIQCPKCATVIPLSEALSADMKDQYRRKFQEFVAQREAEMTQIRKSLEAEREAVANQKQEIELNLQKRLATERIALETKMRDEIASRHRLEMEDLKTQVAEKSRRIEDAEKMELDLRKKAREIEEKERSLELELQRKFDEEKSRIQEETTRKLTEEVRLKSAEKDKQLDDMRRQIEDLKRKAEQGSQQSQGEVLELEIEATLKVLFPLDQIEPVPKGMRGGDIIQKVITTSGQSTGIILWETKRTRTWSDLWIEKLKDDQRAIAAEFSILVTQSLPKDVSHMALIDGVWVVDFATFRGIAVALRANLLQLFQARSVASGKGEKMEFLYNYLTGTQFKQRVETIVESFRTMQDDLEREKRALQKAWAAREQQLTRVLTSTVAMVGDIQGIVGAHLPTIAALDWEEPKQIEG